MPDYLIAVLCLIAISAGLAGYHIQKRRCSRVGFVTELVLRFLWVLNLCQIAATLFYHFAAPPGSIPTFYFLTAAYLSFWLGRRVEAIKNAD